MSPEPGSRTASPEKRALLEAFDTVLKNKAEEPEAERAMADAMRRPRGTSRLLMLLCLTVLTFASVYLYIEQPDWIFSAPPAPESLAVREASLRISVASVAQHVERFRQRTGELPATLSQAGGYHEGISYLRTDGGYRLEGEAGDVRVTFDSRESLARFVGNSFKTISRRGR